MQKVTNEKETRALGIEVGDFYWFRSANSCDGNWFYQSRHLDDVAQHFAQSSSYLQGEVKLPNVTTHLMLSVFEEVGHGDNLIILSQVVEYLAVNMGDYGR